MHFDRVVDPDYMVCKCLTRCALQFGQLGVGKGEDRPLPVAVTALADEPIAQAACGWRHTTVVSAAGKVYSWGRGCCGQLGHGDLEDLCDTAVELPVHRGHDLDLGIRISMCCHTQHVHTVELHVLHLCNQGMSS